MLNQKTLLVTGGAGFMGSSFIRTVLKRDHFEGKIINLDLLTYAGNLQNLREVENDPRYLFQRGDICDGKLLRNLQEQWNFDVIVHFAAESHVDRSIENPKQFLETNILGTFELLEIAKNNPEIHFHLISTDEVYGSLGKKGFFSEKSNYAPNSPYSASKAASDHLVRAYRKTYNLKTTVSHASNNYGPYQYIEKLIPTVISKLIERQSIPIYGTGENVRDWLYVDDHTRAVLQILEQGNVGEIYNIGGSNEKSNIDLVHILIEEFANLTECNAGELKQLVTFVPDRLGHDFRYALNHTKIETIGWTPQLSFREGISKTIKWYLSENSLHHSSAT